MSLKAQALSGVKWTSLSSITTAFIQLVQLVVLARYLEPTDFGLMAMASVVMGFSAIYMDMGVSGAIIHEQKVTNTQLSTLYWFNIASGVLIFLAILFSAPLVASFFDQPELTLILQILSVTFLVSAFGSQYKTLFQKELKFNFLAKVTIVSTVVSFVVAVVSAMNGSGVYAFVYAVLTGSVVTTGAFLYFGLKIHRPLFLFKYSEITKMISFGAYKLGAMNLNYFNTQFDVILIGKILGPDALGVYSVAKNLSMRPISIINPIVTNVTFPIISKMQDDRERLKNTYLKAINYLSSVNFPLYITIALLAEPLILVVFGEKWMASIIILQILSIWAMLRSIINPMASLQMAMGKTYMGFWWNLGLFFFVPAMVYLGSFWGLEGVAYTLMTMQAFLVLAAWYFMVRSLCGAGFKEYFGQMVKPFMFALIGGFVTYGSGIILTIDNSIVEITRIMLTMGVTVVIMNLWLQREFINTLLEMIGKKSKRGSHG